MPVFIFLVIVAAIILWFLLSFTFKPFGSFLYNIVRKVANIIKNETDEK